MEENRDLVRGDWAQCCARRAFGDTNHLFRECMERPIEYLALDAERRGQSERDEHTRKQGKRQIPSLQAKRELRLIRVVNESSCPRDCGLRRERMPIRSTRGC